MLCVCVYWAHLLACVCCHYPAISSHHNHLFAAHLLFPLQSLLLHILTDNMLYEFLEIFPKYCTYKAIKSTCSIYLFMICELVC